MELRVCRSAQSTAAVTLASQPGLSRPSIDRLVTVVGASVCECEVITT